MCVIKFAIVKGCEDFLVNPDLSMDQGLPTGAEIGLLLGLYLLTRLKLPLCRKATAFGEETVY